MKKYSATVSCAETPELIINKDYQDLLQRLELDSFSAIWEYPHGQLVKQEDSRSIKRLELFCGSGQKVFYIKRHQFAFAGWRALALRWFPGIAGSQARLEFDNICRFRKKGLNTVIPVAAGQRRAGFFRVDSFLVTRDFSPFVSLEFLLENQPDFFTGPGSARRKSILMTQIAALARKMHQSGFHHRDFNATHILLHYEAGSDVPELALFDLQRVETRIFQRFRWMVKSLARLNYSLPDTIFGAQDRRLLLAAYRGSTRLGKLDRFRWYWIERKTERIRKHTEKKRAAGRVTYGPGR